MKDELLSIRFLLVTIQADVKKLEAERLLLKQQLAEARADFSSSQIPDGYVLVPVEPSDVMLKAAWEEVLGGHRSPLGPIGRYKKAWRTMVKLAQEGMK